MRITRIEIEKYKSIKEPIEINFYDDLPTVLIGKNGSGKTNILEALDAIAEANSNYFGSNKKHRLSTKCTFAFQKMILLDFSPAKILMRTNADLSHAPGRTAKLTESNRNI